MNTEYLKNVLLGGFASGELPVASPLFRVFAMLLHFTPQEVAQTQAKAAQTGRSQLLHFLPSM